MTESNESEKVHYDIHNTKEAMALGIAIAVAVKNSRADGKIDSADLIHLVAVFPVVGPALEDVSMIPNELKDLDDAEAAELLAEVVLLIPSITDNEKTARVAILAVKAAMAIGALVKELS